jgi:hypothetical protein
VVPGSTNTSIASSSDADRHQQQFLPPGELHQPVPPEEEAEREQADRARQREARRPNLDEQAQQPDRHQQRADDGIA